MVTTLQKQSIKEDLVALLIATTIALIGYLAVAPHYLPASKIEEGTVVVKNDSVTTVVIPDKTELLINPNGGGGK